ncbi:MAG: hypothetical protein A2751_04985 [Candidatus Doudnabacteria bacterium RIFCSPHIGHO2_01_FULL_46_14]|uniref:DNA recombination protein RmuC n=1 Tax=Candidatus Doudnabacteria bacterium RIFCSPHIGHO2_01_FULL_46_14 TaxID=1817824 RepID=A0A1F5NNQ1_9BACT|nr:MAG: hypothetical protein A2751_04985 [Candidatus Doudnabacteria bacterium RIFCSPHIGHO2_01_FULL_46_14]
MNLQIIILAAVIVGFGVVAYFMNRKPKEDEGMKVMLEWLKDMRESSESLQKRVDERLGESSKAVNERLDNAARVISALQKELGGMTQIGPDIRKLSEVLSSSKLRGNFGEEMLEELIKQVLPASAYSFQYRFKNGDVVDAVIKAGGHLLPVDSKFSMENYRLFMEAKTDEAAEGLKKSFFKDVKKRVDEIQKKYILPQEGTYDYALIFIPSEGILGEVLSDASMTTFFREKNVYPVGPSTFYHTMQMVLRSLRGERMNEEAALALRMLAGIKQESEKFGRNLEILGNHIKNAGNSMGLVGNDFSKLKSSIENAASLQLTEKKQPTLEIKDSVDQVADSNLK